MIYSTPIYINIIPRISSIYDVINVNNYNIVIDMVADMHICKECVLLIRMDTDSFCVSDHQMS